MEIAAGLLGLLLVLLIGGLLILFVYLIVKAIVEHLQESQNSAFDQLCQTVETSLKGYRQRDRNEYAGAVHWHCTAKRFNFGIEIRKAGWRTLLSAYFFCPVNQTFRLQFGRAGFRVHGAEEAYEKKLLEEKELTAIVDRLDYFDSISVNKDQVTAKKTYERDTEIGDWPDALGGLITFVRYLLDFERRKEVEVEGQAICPYCKDQIGEAENGIVSCRDCRTAHHRDCWTETGRCSVFGCKCKVELLLG
jgi:hypothetical protein